NHNPVGAVPAYTCNCSWFTDIMGIRPGGGTVYTGDLKSSARKSMRVRIPPWAFSCPVFQSFLAISFILVSEILLVRLCHLVLQVSLESHHLSRRRFESDALGDNIEGALLDL